MLSEALCCAVLSYAALERALNLALNGEVYATTAVFDVECCEWRSFRWESIVKVF